MWWRRGMWCRWRCELFVSDRLRCYVVWMWWRRGMWCRWRCELFMSDWLRCHSVTTQVLQSSTTDGRVVRRAAPRVDVVGCDRSASPAHTHLVTEAEYSHEWSQQQLHRWVLHFSFHTHKKFLAIVDNLWYFTTLVLAENYSMLGGLSCSSLRHIAHSTVTQGYKTLHYLQKVAGFYQT